jgi:hypothetical protein
MVYSLRIGTSPIAFEAFRETNMLNKVLRPVVLATASVIIPLSDSAASGAIVDAVVVVRNGDSSPEGGTFTELRPRGLDAGGTAFFTGTSINTPGRPFNVDGVYGTRPAGLQTIFREGQSVAGGSGIITNAFAYSTGGPNDMGKFLVEAEQSGGGSAGEAIYLGSGGPLELVAERGQAAPRTAGTFTTFVTGQLNDEGDAVFRAPVRVGNNAFADNAIFLFSGGTLTNLVKLNDDLPGPGGVANLGEPVLNDEGHVAFTATLGGSGVGFDNNSGLYVTSAGSAILEVAREGEPAPLAGNVTYGQPRLVARGLNDGGQIAFAAPLQSPVGPSLDSGLFVGGGGAAAQLVARFGDAAPDSNGTFNEFDFFDTLASMTDTGQVLFNASFSGTTGGSSDDTGFFSGLAGGPIQTIAREGGITPRGDATFGQLANTDDNAFNSLGQVAIVADVDGPGGSGSNEAGLFFWDPTDGLTTIARTGDTLDGGIITSMSLGLESVNDSGSVAFGYELDDGRFGVAVWTIPEPASATALLGLAVACSLGMRPRRGLSLRRVD